MKRLLLLSLTILSQVVWGQSIESLSAEQLLDSALKEQNLQHLGITQNLLDKAAEKIDTQGFNELSYEYHLINGINYFDSRLILQSNKSVNRALLIARSLGDSSKVGSVFSQMGNIYVIRGDYTAALDYYEKSLEKLEDSAKYFSTQMNMSQAYMGINEYNEALSTLTSAKEFYEKTENYRDLAVAENNIGEVYRTKIHDAEKAKLHYKRALIANEKIENLHGKAQNYHNLAALYLDMEQPDSAIAPALQSEKLREAVGDSSSLVFSNYMLGSIFKSKAEYKKAILYYEKSLTISKENEILMGVFHNSLDLGQIYFIMGNKARSMEYLNQALKMAEISGDIHLSESAYTGLYEVARANGDYKEAINFLEKKVQLTDSIQSLMAEQNLAGLRTKYETDLKEAENQALKAKEKISSQKLEAKNRLLVFSALSILILLAVGLVLFKFLRDRKKASEKLADQFIRLKEQEEKLQESNDFKNKILSVLGHDLRTPLSGVSTLLGTMSAVELTKEELQELLPHLSKEVDISLETLQQILAWSRLEMDEMNLRLEPIDAEALIQEIIETYQVNTRTKAIDTQLTVEPGLTINADKNQLRSIIANLFSNAIKFSPSGELIKINAFNDPHRQQQVIEVIDYGKGISEKVVANLNDRESVITSKGTSGEKGTGIGLRIAQDFARAHNGQIYFEKLAPKGTKAKLLVTSSQLITTEV